jgi:methylthioribose-1-phosphate isomerase
MNIHGTPCRTVWFADDLVQIIDQRLLPWHFQILDLPTTTHVAHAILDMAVRGAGCIGATAAYGMALAAREAASSPDPSASLIAKSDELNCRPTAVNLAWALKRQLDHLLHLPPPPPGPKTPSPKPTASPTKTPPPAPSSVNTASPSSKTSPPANPPDNPST